MLLALILMLLIFPLYFTALELTSRLDENYMASSIYNAAATRGEEEENEVDNDVVARTDEPTITATKTTPSPIVSKEAMDIQLQQSMEDEEVVAEEEDAVVPENDDEFQVPNANAQNQLERHGCEFGFHSRTRQSSYCYHVSLTPMFSEEADLHCQKMGATLARIPSLEENEFVCQVLDRANNRNNVPGEMHIGLGRSAFVEDDNFYKWRDGKKFNQSLRALLPKEKLFTNLLANAAIPSVVLHCHANEAAGEAERRIWTAQADGLLPFACLAIKPKSAMVESAAAEQDRAPVLDSTWNEESDLETPKWTDVATFEEKTCPSIAQHLNPSLANLPEQIKWRLTDYTPRGEPKRYYLVWQSKSWFGWLDFWVEYLVKFRDVRGAPIGRFVTSSRAASEHLGWSNIFANPGLAQKFGTSLIVFSRLPIPENVLWYFPEGTLVNQVYYDPFARVPLGDKLELNFALASYASALKNGGACDLQITPETFDISQPKSCVALRDRLTAAGGGKEENWIIKGPHHGGAAITIATQEQVLKRLGGCTSAALQRLHQRHEIVQKLVDDPLLLDGRKFDLRVFVLIASTQPLLVYVHRDAYFRAAMRKYNGLEKNRHVTNTHIQKSRGGNFTDRDWADHIWTLDRVKHLASRANIDPEFFTRSVFPKIKRSLQVVLKATAGSLVHRRPGQWKLFGVDFVIDSQLRPFLLDWNSFPGWDWSYRLPWTLEYRKRILGDAWRLTLDVQRGKAISSVRATPKSGGFELIYHTK